MLFGLVKMEEFMFGLVKMEEFMFGLGKISSFYSVHIWFGTI